MIRVGFGVLVILKRMISCAAISRIVCILTKNLSDERTPNEFRVSHVPRMNSACLLYYDLCFIGKDFWLAE